LVPLIIIIRTQNTHDCRSHLRGPLGVTTSNYLPPKKRSSACGSLKISTSLG